MDNNKKHIIAFSPKISKLIEEWKRKTASKAKKSAKPVESVKTAIAQSILEAKRSSNINKEGDLIFQAMPEVFTRRKFTRLGKKRYKTPLRTCDMILSQLVKAGKAIRTGSGRYTKVV